MIEETYVIQLLHQLNLSRKCMIFGQPLAFDDLAGDLFLSLIVNCKLDDAECATA